MGHLRKQMPYFGQKKAQVGGRAGCWLPTVCRSGYSLRVAGHQTPVQPRCARIAAKSLCCTPARPPFLQEKLLDNLANEFHHVQREFHLHAGAPPTAPQLAWP